MKVLAGFIAAGFLFLGHSAATRAEATGQERAVAAGRDLIGKPAPRVMLTTIDGSSIDLGDIYGKKAVYIKFWATWCVPCRQQMPHFQHTFETAGPDLAVIAVNTGFNDTLEAVKRYRHDLGITMPIVLDDGSLANRFHLRVTPTHIIIGRDGRVQYVGHLADASLDEALIAATSGRSVGSSHPIAAGQWPASSDSRPIAIGDLLPPLLLKTLSGRTLPLRKKGDEITAVLFFSPWCESYLATSRPEAAADCRRAREQVAALADRKGIRWVGIASGLWANEDDLVKYRAEHHVAVPMALDATGNVFREFRVNDVPTLILADSSAHVVRRVDPSGVRDDGISSAVDSLGVHGR